MPFFNKNFYLSILFKFFLFYNFRYIVVGGKDMTARVYSLYAMENMKAFSLTGHRNTIVNCFFEKDSLNVSFQNVL